MYLHVIPNYLYWSEIHAKFSLAVFHIVKLLKLMMKIYRESILNINKNRSKHDVKRTITIRTVVGAHTPSALQKTIWIQLIQVVLPGMAR